MKLYVVTVVNGTMQTNKITEWSDKDKAIVSFHQKCSSLWNDESVLTANVKILTETLDTFEGYSEYIEHESNLEE